MKALGRRLALLALSACGGAGSGPTPAATPPPTPTVETSTRSLPTDAPAGCPAMLDVAALLRAHAAAYGSPAAVANAAPFTLRMDVEVEKKRGSYELVIGRGDAFRSEQSVSGVYGAAGRDAKGFWSLGLAGVGMDLREDEAPGPAFEAWLARRTYVEAFDPAKDSAECGMRGQRPQVVVRYARPLVGNPELLFDYLTATLLTASSESADGGRGGTSFESWTLPNERGLRFPRDVVTESALAARTVRRMVTATSGLACKGVDPNYPAESCLARPTERLAFEWPGGPAQQERVRVPMRNYLGQISFEVTVDGRKTWALLDSGAGISAVDANTATGRAFKTALEVTGSGSSQIVRLGLGELESLRIGELTLRHLPTASVPIPALEDFGLRRPEVIVGYSVFAGAAVRVDYTKEEVVLAKSADALVKRGAVAVPFRVWEGRFVVDAEVEGTAAPLVLDTGSSSGISFRKLWADAHGLPGARRVIALQAQSGAGEASTVATLFRLGAARIGPIHYDEQLAHIDNPPGKNRLAGLVGNQVLRRCPAVVFDVAHRTLWLEGPCARMAEEALAGWRLTKRMDTQRPDRPWVVETVLPGSAAEAAGIVAGDRILSVAGVPATLDLAKLQAQVERPEGTRIAVDYETATRSRKTVTLVLRRVLGK